MARSSAGDAVYADPVANPIYQRLRQAWIDELGLDYSAQAMQMNPETRL